MDPKTNQGPVIVIQQTSSRRITKSQQNAFIGASFPIMTMGFYIAWNSYLIVYPNQWIQVVMSNNELIHALLSWHITFIVGAAIAAFIVKKMEKSKVYIVSTILIIISGALMIPSWGDLAPVIVARYIGGLGHGTLFLLAIIHASEVASPEHRGKVVGALSFYLATSLFIGFMIMGFMQLSDFHADQLLGIITVVLCLIGLALSRWTFIESPVYYLENNDSGAALSSLAKLRNEPTTSWSVNNEFSQLQELVSEQSNESCWVFKDEHLTPLLRTMLVRGVYAIANVLVINTFAYLFLIIELEYYGLAVAYGARFIVEMVGMYATDKMGRRLMLPVSTLCSGALFIVIGGLLMNTIDLTILWACGLLFIFQSVTLGMGLGPVSVVYMGESFSLKKKPFSIFFTLLFEQMIYIIVIVIYRYTLIRADDLFLATGIIQVIFAGIFFVTTPESRNLTLKQSKDALKEKVFRL